MSPLSLNELPEIREELPGSASRAPAFSGCRPLLWRFRDLDVNMSSTFECSRNDVLANTGVLLAAAGVAAFDSGWPDIVVGLAIAALFLRSAVRVIRSAWPQFRHAASPDVGA